MKTFLTGVAAVVLCAGMAMAADPPKPTAPAAPAKPTTQPTKPVNKMCAVEQAHEADAKVTYTWNKKVYAFCCEGCIDEFKKNPEKYKDAK